MPFEVAATGEVVYLPEIMCGKSQAWGKVVGPAVVHHGGDDPPKFGVPTHKPARNAMKKLSTMETR